LNDLDDETLPAGWTWTCLGEVVEVLDHCRVPVSAKERAQRSGNVPYYGATGRVGYIDAALFDEELVLLGEDGVQFFDRNKAKAYRISGPAWVNNHAHVIRARKGVALAPFLVHYLNCFNYDGYANGTTRLKLTKSSMISIPVPLPPLPEQHRIVDALEAHLSRLDAAENLITRIASRARRLGEIVSSITYGYGVSGGEPSALVPAPNGTDDGRLPSIPTSWSWRRLEEIADVVGGVTKDEKKQSDPDLSEVPYLRVANVQRGRLDLSDISFIRVPDKKARQLALRHGDVLLNEGGDRDKLGRGWIWQDQIPGAIHQNHVFRARIREGVIHPKLLSWYANSAAHWFETNGKQSVNLASISLSRIRQLPVPVPPLREQTVIVERIEDQLSILDATKRLSIQTLTRSKALRRALLAQAFSGKLVVQDPADEPASVLLDRIQAEPEAQPNRHMGNFRRPPGAAAAKALPPPPQASDRVPTTTIQQEFPF
jgi:type I restriction enzyme S subunit